MKHVLYGKCVKCGKTYDAVPDLTNCECGGILDIVYDYVLQDLRKQKKCYVRYEFKQGCFHITVR